MVLDVIDKKKMFIPPETCFASGTPVFTSGFLEVCILVCLLYFNRIEP
jgi:hypothetical protein